MGNRARGPAWPAREPKVHKPESDALGSGRVALMPSRAVRSQGKGTEALMPASVALRGAGTLGSGVAKPQVKHLIGVSDPHRASPRSTCRRRSAQGSGSDPSPRRSPTHSLGTARAGRARRWAPASHSKPNASSSMHGENASDQASAPGTTHTVCPPLGDKGHAPQHTKRLSDHTARPAQASS